MPGAASGLPDMAPQRPVTRRGPVRVGYTGNVVGGHKAARHRHNSVHPPKFTGSLGLLVSVCLALQASRPIMMCADAAGVHVGGGDVLSSGAVGNVSMDAPTSSRLSCGGAGAAADCVYGLDNGVYWQTYTGPLSRSVVHKEDLEQLEQVLALDYVVGVSHYQNWSTAQPSLGVYNWTVLDAVFDATTRHNKSVILGLQMGVCAPAWLLRSGNVSTARFVHGNPGWFPWASLQSYVDGEPVITMAHPWDNPRYELAVEVMVKAMADRYAHHPALTFVNVAGASVSGGVEANFNVDYTSSRRIITGFDEQLGYTEDKFTRVWQSRIDLYLSHFPGRVGLATHDQPGDFGFEGGHIVQYSTANKMTTARAIRDYLLSRCGSMPGCPTPLIRNCGGSNDTYVWGVPNVTVGGPHNLSPPGTFAQLLWEVRMKAHIGVEQSRIVPRVLSTADQQNYLDTALRLQTYYNARYIEIKTVDLVTLQGAPYKTLQAQLVKQSATMKGCCLPWNCTEVACEG